MKYVDKKKPVKTIPDGVWESSRDDNKKSTASKTTDLQGNGYPVKNQNKST